MRNWILCKAESFARFCIFGFFVWVLLNAHEVNADGHYAYERTLDKKSEEVYAWIKSLQLANGLVESRKHSNFITVYDNALAALVFSIRGDFSNAEKIFDFFVSRIPNEFQTFPGGFGQFRDRQGIPTESKPHRWLGDNAWLLIAIHNYHNLHDSDKYQNLAQLLENWIRSLQDQKDGGVWGGFDKEGGRIDKSTEATIDVFNAVRGYDQFHKKILGFLGQGYWDKDQKLFLSWREHKNYKYALDTHSWGYCAFPRMTRDILKNTDRYLVTKTAVANGEKVTGFCFDTDLDTIWLEGTGQMVVAFQSAGMYAEAKKYLREMNKMILVVSEKSHAGLPYVTNKGTHYAHGKLWREAETMPSVSSSVWYLFGKMGFDPMEQGRKKKIPSRDRFWK